MIYIGAPYSHQDPTVRSLRHQLVNDYASRLIKQGRIVFSPLSHSHVIAFYLTEEECLDHELWMKQDLFFLEKSKEMHVLKLPGWERSKGLQREIKQADVWNISVKYINPEDLENIHLYTLKRYEEKDNT